MSFDLTIKLCSDIKRAYDTIPNEISLEDEPKYTRLAFRRKHPSFEFLEDSKLAISFYIAYYNHKKRFRSPIIILELATISYTLENFYEKFVSSKKIARYTSSKIIRVSNKEWDFDVLFVF